MVTEEDRWRRQDLADQRVMQLLAESDQQAAMHFQEIMALWEELLAGVERWNRSLSDAVKPGQAAPSDHLKELRRYADEKRKQPL